MKTFFAWPGLALATALVLIQSAAAVPAVLNLGAAASFSGLAGADKSVVSGPVHTWDPLTQKARMNLDYAYLGAGVLSGAIQAQGVPMVNAGGYGGSGLSGIGGVLPPNSVGGANALGNFQGGSTPTAALGGSVPLTYGVQAGAVLLPVGSPGAPGTGSNVSGASPALTNGILTTGTIVGGVPMGDEGVTLNSNPNGRPSLFVVTVEVPDTGSVLFLLSFGLVTLLAFGAKCKKCGGRSVTA